MKITILALALALPIFQTNALADSQELLYSCKPVQGSNKIGRVLVTYSEASDQYTLGIEWLLPPSLKEAPADYLSDHTLTEGYDAPEMKARLMFYTENDDGGERTVLELHEKEIPMDCQYKPLSPRVHLAELMDLAKKPELLECGPSETYKRGPITIDGRRLRLIFMNHATHIRQAPGVGIKKSGRYELCVDYSGNGPGLITAAKRILD